MQKGLETERLILRKITFKDEPHLFRLDSNEAVHRYLGNSPVKSTEQIKTVIQFIQDQYKKHGIARYAVVLKETNEFIGWAGLKFVEEKINGHHHFYDIGYRIIKEHWGKGYATEAAQAWIDFGFTKLKAKKIFAMVHFENDASIKVLQKLNMKAKNTFELDGIPHQWYEIVRGE